MAALTTDKDLLIDAAIAARDVKQLMVLLWSDRFTAEFIIGLAFGETDGCLTHDPVAQKLGS